MRSHTGRLDAQGNYIKPKDKGKRWDFFEIFAFAAFIFWSAAGLIFTVGHISPETVSGWSLPDGLHRFVDLCLGNGDPILILLAFINTHLHAARQWTAGIARRWGAIVVVLAFVVETVGAQTGLPFGVYHYTNDFGPMLGIVPLTIPLAWHVVVTNALFLVRAGAPHVSRIAEAVLAGSICTIYDFVLEPFATTIKHYWIWADKSVPPLNYIAWFVISAALIFVFAPTASNRYRFDLRPLFVLGLTLAIFLAAEIR
jgi:uncharacterized membrane protein